MSNLCRNFKKCFQVLMILMVSLLFTVSMTQAAVDLVTDQAEWEAMVTGSEALITNAGNVALADEVTDVPGPNSKLGPFLTFDKDITGLSVGFTVVSLQSQPDVEDPYNEAGFTFNDTDSGSPITDSVDALSVGDTDDFENDDWELQLHDATMTAFGVEIRHSRDMISETITLSLMSNNEVVEILDLDLLVDPEDQTGRVFLGIVSDVPFDNIVYNASNDGDDIAIADFRFANVKMGTEYRSTLGNNRRSYFRDVDIFAFKGAKGEEVTINLDKDLSGNYRGERATLILMDKMRGVRFFKYDRGALPNEITAILPATGMYRVIIIEHCRYKRGMKFIGDYVLSMDSSEGASDTLQTTRWVE